MKEKKIGKEKTKLYKRGSIPMLFALLLAVCCVGCSRQEREVTIGELTVCHLENPLGIDEEAPTFSWQMKSNERGTVQTAYRIMVAKGLAEMQNGQYVWDSQKTQGDKSTGILYEGAPLEAKTRYYWKAEVWDEKDRLITSVGDTWFETGLMGGTMGDAKWISAPKAAEESRENKEFSYTIKYDMEVSDTTAGFAFGAENGRYGKLYLCEIKNREGEKQFRLKQMENNSFIRTEETDIDDTAEENSDVFHVELQVREEMLSVIINGEKIGEYGIEKTSVGSIGYYKSRGTTYAFLDNIEIFDEQGKRTGFEDFEKEENMFAPFYVPVEEGRLKIGSGLMLTKGKENPAPFFRKEFRLKDKEIESARLYMTSLGSLAVSVNGSRASEDYLSPGKFAYNKELTYVTYDITSLLRSGEKNALGIILLHGWYDRGVGYTEIFNPWGDKNALLGKVEIQYRDGSKDEFVTDESFLYSTDGPIREDDLYWGEYYDANYELTGFDEPGFADEGWKTASVNEIDEAYFTLPFKGKQNEPIACVEVLEPIGVWEPQKGVFVYDFGQNFAGTCEIKVKGEKGQVVTLRYAEALNRKDMINTDDAEGTVWTENLATAEATDYYVLKGDGEEAFEPEFVFHGFRYLQLTGLDEALPLENVKGKVLSSDLTRTGYFACSDKNLNRYYENTVWSQRSNFMDNPMDCPQRDERHGWAGDAQVFSLTAAYHMDVYAFYAKFVRELRLLQSEGGSFPDMAPRNFGTDWDGTGGGASNNCWGDAAVVITWNLYQQYGDKAIIEENYDALCKWVDMLVATSEDYIRNWGGYGDHLALENTPADVSDTAWCARSADLLSKMARATGREEDAAHYKEIYEKFKAAWQRQYVLPDGMTLCHSQTSYALGLCFGLFPEELEQAAAMHLVKLLQSEDYHIKTGFSGIGYLLPALSQYGFEEAAYKVLLKEEYPSFLYAVKNGATTTWELWQGYYEEKNGYRLEGSMNHYAYGTPASWLYTDVLGIKSDEENPGYKHILLEPKTEGELSKAEGSFTSAYGEIIVKWEKTEEGCTYFIEIPANTSATLTLPYEEGKTYRESGKAAEKAKGVVFWETNGDKVRYELLSGSYCFTSK